MRCPNHLLRPVAGYCSVCGSFACEECLVRHEGNLYCKKHYKPIAEKLQRAEVRKKHGRHYLIVNFKDGHREFGICMNLNTHDPGFHLECTDRTGATLDKTIRVRFKDVKSVCTVKSLDGKSEKSEHFRERPPGGNHIVVEFQDGEVMEGYTQHAYDPDQPRFHLIPFDDHSNNISVLIEHSAVAGVYSPDEYRQIKEARETKPKEEPKETAELSQEESMGDFYFETHNYPGALEQYTLASKRFPESPRLNRKMIVATYNIGIQYMKKRDYRNSLQYMEKTLELDPDNRHAKKKAQQLKKVIEKTERRMREYERQRFSDEG